jgi:hypothetical protein
MSPLYSTNADVYLDLHKYNAKKYEKDAEHFRLIKASQSRKSLMDSLTHIVGSWLIKLGEMLQKRAATRPSNYIEPHTTMSGIK